jgi:hypothetical protein
MRIYPQDHLAARNASKDSLSTCAVTLVSAPIPFRPGGTTADSNGRVLDINTAFALGIKGLMKDYNQFYQ